MMKYSKHLLLSLLFSAFAAPSYAADTVPASRYGESDAPIEITSDVLDVFQADNRAVFTGHVVAVQGKVRIKSDKMIVFYRKPEEGQTKPAGAPQQDKIDKIEVEGSVFLSTPDETAKGQTGVYDVDKKEIRLNDQVTLTRANNTLKGDKLVYNLISGKSVITSAGAPPQDGSKPQRVRALLVPEKKDAEKKDAGSVTQPKEPTKP
ncbi:MAG: lipopolysaccharide transport periplasmic protein LptA [Rickettsiales bacterium]|nr:lipopolysaccharide transport periplasmic protein LptA [Rickettsiales bacterium]